MILRKVSNLRPGDRIKIHDNIVHVEEIKLLPPAADYYEVTTDGVIRKLRDSDLVEIVIL